METKPKGLFSRLTEAPPPGAKTWGGQGLLFIMPACSLDNEFRPCATPLQTVGAIPASHVEPGKTLTHGEFMAEKTRRAVSSLAVLKG